MSIERFQSWKAGIGVSKLETGYQSQAMSFEDLKRPCAKKEIFSAVLGEGERSRWFEGFVKTEKAKKLAIAQVRSHK